MKKKHLLKTASFLLILVMLTLVFINPSFDARNNGETLLQTAENRVLRNIQNSTYSIECNKFSDSIRSVTNFEKNKLHGMGLTVYLLTAGLANYDECDSCTNLVNFSSSETKTKYFLSFKNFALQPNSFFYIKNGKYFLEEFVAEKDNSSSQTGHTEIREIKVRLGVGHWDKKTFLLLPVSKKKYQILEILFYVLMPLSILLGFWIFIFMPFRLLMNIAAGRPFISQNIKYLKIIGWTTIGITLFVVIIPLLVKLILHNTIPDKIYYPFWGVLLNYKWELFIGIAILIIANAFETGHNLKQEQDLTV